VQLTGELDLATVGTVHDAIRSLMGSKRSITLDLRGLTFIDSTGLRLILETDALARQDGFNLAVVKGPAVVQRIFAITGAERTWCSSTPQDLAAAGLTRLSQAHG
jgi:anti-sigma B factor antagonist